jgi:hypothetical protein
LPGSAGACFEKTPDGRDHRGERSQHHSSTFGPVRSGVWSTAAGGVHSLNPFRRALVQRPRSRSRPLVTQSRCLENEAAKTVWIGLANAMTAETDNIVNARVAMIFSCVTRQMDLGATQRHYKKIYNASHRGDREALRFARTSAPNAFCPRGVMPISPSIGSTMKRHGFGG